MLILGRKAVANLDTVLKSRDITLLTKVCMLEAMVLLVFTYLDCKEGGVPKNWCLRTVVLEKTPESPLDSKEIKPVNLKGNQPFILVGSTDAETETPVFWPPDGKSRLIGKVSDAGEDWGLEKKGAREDERVRWHHQVNGHEFEQTLGDNEGQGNMAYYSPWGCKESDMS